MKKTVLSVLVFILIVLFACACSPKEDELRIVSITDTHFTGKENFSYEGSFLLSNDSNGTGKQIRYIEEILDAFIAEMLEEKPDVIVVTGDIAFDGAKVSHIAIAEKFAVLEEAGISILVLPGNHDITGNAIIFPEGEPVAAESVTPEEFTEIYSEFGYSEAFSKDPASLSYVYDAGKGVRIFMLDTNLVYGVTLGQIGTETIEWLEEQLAACVEADLTPVVAGHHSLLSHNPRFDFSYKLGNGDEIAELITEYGVSLYLCGHLHTQHYVQNEKMTDIVNGGFCVYPHRYGVIDISAEGWNYESKTTDVAAYAESIGSTDENLLNYDEYGYNFFYNNAYEQAKGSIYEVVADKELAEYYTDLSAQLNVAYFGGTYSDVDLSFAEDFIAATEGTGWSSYMKTVLLDTKDNIYCHWPIEENE